MMPDYEPYPFDDEEIFPWDCDNGLPEELDSDDEDDE